ncbi:hypothetical protein GCM10028772_38680 [Nocardioides ultimimeridianus]
MAGMSRLRRSIRCHLKHGTRCPHIERHSLRRPRSKKKRLGTAPEQLNGRHVAH